MSESIGSWVKEVHKHCPHKDCKIRLIPIGPTLRTLVYYPPIYDEEGRNVNPDRNITTQGYQCLTCGCKFLVRWGYDWMEVEVIEVGEGGG